MFLCMAFCCLVIWNMCPCTCFSLFLSFSPFKAQFKCCHFHKASPTPQVARIRFFFGLDFPSGLIHCVLILCYLYYWFSGKKFPTTSPSHRWDMVGSPSWSFRAKACLGGHWTKVSTWWGVGISVSEGCCNNLLQTG